MIDMFISILNILNTNRPLKPILNLVFSFHNGKSEAHIYLYITQDHIGPMQHSLKLNLFVYKYMTSTKYRLCPTDTKIETQTMIEASGYSSSILITIK